MIKDTMMFYRELAIAINWLSTVNDAYRSMAEDKFNRLVEMLPHGSGLDAGCKVLLEESSGDKIVIQADFHHINEHGYYDGWTEHKVIIRPCLMYGYTIRITGKDRNYIKDYLFNLFANII